MISRAITKGILLCFGLCIFGKNMKTFYKLLGWIFGISAFSAMVSGIIIPISSGGLSNEEGLFRLLIIFFLPTELLMGKQSLKNEKKARLL